MTLAYWCILAAGILPYILITLAKAGAPNFDNVAPRVFVEHLQGWRKRAYWAHLNAFEAFPLFAAAVIIAHLLGTHQKLIDELALAFIAARILHGIFYIANWAALRSLIWFLGFGVVIALFVVSNLKVM